MAIGKTSAKVIVYVRGSPNIRHRKNIAKAPVISPWKTITVPYTIPIIKGTTNGEIDALCFRLSRC
jgi:hypothetical protein